MTRPATPEASVARTAARGRMRAAADFEGRMQVPLTQLSSCAGCAAKLSQTLLAELLVRIAETNGDARINRNLLVGAHTFDDAGIYRLTPELALVQTVDFFTPIVDDPYDYGQIAAANALSDVYAMGGRPVTAMNLLGVPTDRLGPAAIAAILRGGADMARAADCTLIGGHTIRLPEPIYGLSVTGVVHPKKILSNAAARPGDVLILTKPLGTGIATTAIKRGLASAALKRKVVKSMKHLNAAGAVLAGRSLASAATDVTGFGLLGHLGNIVRASGLSATVDASAVPSFSREVERLIDAGCVPGGTRTNMDAAAAFTDFDASVPDSRRTLLADAQTSGGLLLCVAPKRVTAVLKLLKKLGTLEQATIGSLSRGRARILVAP